MPASVKIFFENEQGFQKRIKEAEKVFQFQTAQVKMFVAKKKESREQYFKTRKQHHANVQEKQNLKQAIEMELAWIDKCKMAYRLGFLFFPD